MATDGLFFTKAYNKKERDNNRKFQVKELEDVSAINIHPNNDALLEDIPEEDIKLKAETREKLLVQGVFGGQLGREVSDISRYLGREGQHQSDRDLPPINFAQGITKTVENNRK